MIAKNVFGIVGWQNSGKTTLIEALLAEFTARGLRISTIKHAHHAFDIDIPTFSLDRPGAKHSLN